MVLLGPYANAVLRFSVEFPDDYPERSPIVTFLSEVFHPLVTPLTTYTYSTRDSGSDTVSAADSDRLPPGGLSLRHGFPEWFDSVRDGTGNKGAGAAQSDQQKYSAHSGPVPNSGVQQRPQTVEILQYLRIVFDTEVILDSVPLEAAANTGAWHAWKSYRSRLHGRRASPATSMPSNESDTMSERSTSPRQQPGGARRPAEWNWQGVWEDRVKKSVQASMSEHVLYAGENHDVICFSKMGVDAVSQILPTKRETSVT